MKRNTMISLSTAKKQLLSNSKTKKMIRNKSSLKKRSNKGRYMSSDLARSSRKQSAIKEEERSVNLFGDAIVGGRLSASKSRRGLSSASSKKHLGNSASREDSDFGSFAIFSRRGSETKA